MVSRKNRNPSPCKLKSTSYLGEKSSRIIMCKSCEPYFHLTGLKSEEVIKRNEIQFLKAERSWMFSLLSLAGWNSDVAEDNPVFEVQLLTSWLQHWHLDQSTTPSKTSFVWHSWPQILPTKLRPNLGLRTYHCTEHRTLLRRTVMSRSKFTNRRPRVGKHGKHCWLHTSFNSQFANVPTGHCSSHWKTVAFWGSLGRL